MIFFKPLFHLIFFIFFCGFVSLLSVADSVAADDKNILISPTRVIFEEKTRSVVVKLINPNNSPKTYEISIAAIRMDESGKKEYVDSPNDTERLSIDMIRYSPRRVTIGPKVWQTVRLMVRKPKDLPPGEYRTQLRAIPVLEKEEKTENEESKTNKVSVNIKYAFSISIPIIVRHGEGNVSIVSNKPMLITKNELYYLETKLERTGLHSAYYDVAAFFTPSGKTERMEIGSCKGLSFFAENNHVFIHIPVKNKDILTQGKIEIEVRDREKMDNPLMHSNGYDINGMTVVNKNES